MRLIMINSQKQYDNLTPEDMGIISPDSDLDTKTYLNTRTDRVRTYGEWELRINDMDVFTHFLDNKILVEVEWNEDLSSWQES
jgi:hypothetical protein